MTDFTNFNIPKMPDFSRLSTSPISMPVLPKIENHNNASAFYDRLKSYIIDFESGLDQDQEVGARLVSFGQTVTFHIEDIGYWNPSLITFTGTTDDGQQLKLVQHVTQISVLLMSVKRIHPEKERIGYKLSQEKDAGD